MPRRAAPKPASVAEPEEVIAKKPQKKTAAKRAASASPSPAPAAKRRSTGATAAAAAVPVPAGSPGGPLYADGDNVMAHWEGKWYPVTILSGGLHKKRGHWLYEIRWDGFANTAPASQLPSNESTYPENWIWTKAEVKADEELEAAKKKKPAKKKTSPAKATTGRPKATTSPAPPTPVAVAPKPVSKASRKATSQASQEASSPSQSQAEGVRWQYFDNKKGGGDRGWHNYDIPASKKVEEAYQSWVTDPAIDVRAVKSGQWNYMVDFNMMQQTNIDHEAHTVRKIRRMDATGQKPLMQEAQEIQRRVKLTRKQSQSDQLSRTSSTVGDAAAAAVTSTPTAATPASPATQRSASQGRITRSASASAVAAATASSSQDGWRVVTSVSEISAGMSVRVSAAPTSGYPYEHPHQFGKEATVLTVGGYPAVHLRFADGATYWYRETDLEVRSVA